MRLLCSVGCEESHSASVKVLSLIWVLIVCESDGDLAYCGQFCVTSAFTGIVFQNFKYFINYKTISSHKSHIATLVT